MRCANRLKDNTCFPSVKTIAQNCSIPSETTVRAAIQELHDIGLIKKETRGRKNFYQIDKLVYLAIDLANGKECNINELEDISSYSDGIENEEIENSAMDTHSDVIPPPDGEIAPHGGCIQHRYVVPNKTKQTKLITNTNKKEKEQNSQNRNFRVRTEKSFPTTGKTTSLSVVNEFYQTLTDKEKMKFDSAARALVPSGEANREGSIKKLRTDRLRFYELLMQEPKRNDGFEHYNVPPDEIKLTSEPRGLLN
ncbi:MAG: helix-turn-helix domain-containing protein [Candidatus Dadabacteria bacterium]|nr:helix-turn-helix domain-containing protein [Candidatus Dadabacteria bacterium]